MFEINSSTFRIWSPTVDEWLRIIQQQRPQLINPKIEMTALLAAVRQDVDKQFDEKQSEWTPLASFTVEKKASAGSDPRILHESKTQGTRLRDAYANAGMVDSGGKLTFSYPESKPYAREHQEGVGGIPKKKMSSRLAREMKRLDDEYNDIFKRH